MRAEYLLGILPLVTGIGLGLGVYWVAVESGGDGSGEVATATPGSGEISEPPDGDSSTPHPEVQEAIDAVADDATKDEFLGSVGDFVVSGTEAPNNYPCDSDRVWASEEALTESELALDAGLLEGDQAAECNGIVFSVTGFRLVDTSRAADVYRFYFEGAQLRVPIRAPIERIELIEIGDRSAILERERQDLFPECRLFLIERYPSENPGVAWEVSGTLTCDEATALVEELIAAEDSE